MGKHGTGHKNAFICVAEDCPAVKGVIPPLKNGRATVARFQYEMIAGHPYGFTTDDVVFACFAMRNGIAERDMEAARESFFSKGQPCLRASPLAKRYGWGIHCDGNGKVAVYGCETEEYRRFAGDGSLKNIRALKSGK